MDDVVRLERMGRFVEREAPTTGRQRPTVYGADT
jgi:hypothetical protein